MSRYSKRVFGLLLTFLFPIGVLQPLAHAENDPSFPALKIQSGQAQLFIDDYVINSAPLRIGDELIYYYDELIYYYGASSWGKNQPRDFRVSGGGIFRARLRLDGFVSVDGGSLLTRPLNFDGRDLLVNGVGPIEVEALKVSGESLAKALVQSDSLAHKIDFSQHSLRELAPGGAVRLRFTVQPGGHLYSFKIHVPAGVAAERCRRTPPILR